VRPDRRLVPHGSVLDTVEAFALILRWRSPYLAASSSPVVRDPTAGRDRMSIIFRMFLSGVFVPSWTCHAAAADREFNPVTALARHPRAVRTPRARSRTSSRLQHPVATSLIWAASSSRSSSARDAATGDGVVGLLSACRSSRSLRAS